MVPTAGLAGAAGAAARARASADEAASKQQPRMRPGMGPPKRANVFMKSLLQRSMPRERNVPDRRSFPTARSDEFSIQWDGLRAIPRLPVQFMKKETDPMRRVYM